MKFYPIDFSIQGTEENFHIEIIGRNEEFEQVSYTDRFTNFYYVIGELSKLESIFEKREEVTKIEILKKDILGKETDVLKVYLNIIRVSKEMRKELFAIEGVEDILEADLPFIRKYLVHKQIIPLKEHEITTNGKEIITIEPSDEFIPFSKLNVLAFDIETYATSKKIDTQKNPILSIAVHSSKNQRVFTWSSHTTKHSYIDFCDDEKSMIEEFLTFIKEEKPDIITGYNSDQFDWAYIRDRCDILKIKLPVRFVGGVQKHATLKLLPHIDLFHFIRVTMRQILKTTSLSLDNVSKELLGDEKVGVDIAKLHIAWDEKNDAQLDEYMKYNLHDCTLCHKLLETLFPNILEFVQMIHMPIQDITRMSFSQLVDWYLINRAGDFNTLTPNRPYGEELDRRLLEPKNEGAFVVSPTPGFYENIVVFDFQSLYPSIIASLNLEAATMTDKEHGEKVPEIEEEMYFSQTKKGFIPSVIKDIVLRRVKIKNMLKKEKDDFQRSLLKARIYNLKILANSMYGYLAFVYARWHSNKAAAATTAYARHYIKFTIKEAENAGFKVLYGDTDSIFLELREKTQEDAHAFVAKLNDSLPGIMKLEFESYFITGIFVGARGSTAGAKKRYALYSDTGKFKITGLEYVRTDWSMFARETQRELISILLKERDKEKGILFVREQIEKLEKHEIPIENLIMSSKLSRDVDQYTTNLPQVIIAKQMIAQGDPVSRGSIITYLVCKGGKNLYEKVRIPSEVSYDDLDMDYYKKHQLLPVCMSLLEVFGIAEEDLIGTTKQNNLNAFFS